MVLSLPFQKALEQLLETIDPKTLEEASRGLSEQYRTTFALQTPEQRLAYLAARMPATYAAVQAVFSHCKELNPKSILDLGAGPGTVGFAAHEQWPTPRITHVEQDPLFIDLGKRLGSPGSWHQGDLATYLYPTSDLTVLSYVLGEIENLQFLERVWQATGQAIVLIEPGTPRGFEKILEARSLLVALGGHLLAPCPHDTVCPLAGTKDWCHFSVRLERSLLHRRAKLASLPFEDEKFAYAVITKETFPTASRILRDPQKRKGHVHLSLCTSEGLRTETVSRRNKDQYKKARKASWGDRWET